MTSLASIIDQFRSAMAECGIAYSGHIQPDIGKITRITVDGDRRGSLNGWYILHTDGVPAGEFGSFKLGVQSSWCSKSENTLTETEKTELARKRQHDKELREAEQRARFEAAASIAADKWASAEPANDQHPYLVRKGVKAHGLRLATWIRTNEGGQVWASIKDALIVPIRKGKRIVSLQAIFPSSHNPLMRDKDFLSGGEKRGCFFAIGKPPANVANFTLVICEGYATGASIYEAVGHPVLVAFDAANLEHVAIFARDVYPACKIIIAADNDRWTVVPTHNPGVTYARKAAAACNGVVRVPEFSSLDGNPTDFNDLAQRDGAAAVAEIINGAADTPAANDNAPRVIDYGFGAPIDIFGIQEPPSFPLDVLPECMIDYVADQSALLGSDPAIIAMTSLASAAACITDAIQLQPKRYDPTWTESTRLWVAVVGDPSTKKSPAIAKAVRHVKRINGEMVETNNANEGRYQSSLDEWKDLNKEAKKQGSPLPMPEKPALNRLLVEDTTIEALSEILKDNPRGVLCLRDELTGWFASMDAYKSGGKGASMDRANWLETYNGGKRSIDRVNRGSVMIPNWSVCMIGGIQEEMIRRVASSMGHDGLLQRFMVICARSAVRDVDRVPNMEAMDRYRQLFDQLVAIQAPSSGDVIKLTAHAHICRERVSDHAHKMIKAFDHPHLKAWLGKWDGLFARLLAVYHTIDCANNSVYPTTQEVSVYCAEKVERLMCGYLLHHAIHFYAEIIDANDQMQHTRQLARFILAKKLTRITRREIAQGWKASRSLADWELQKVILTLCNYDWMMPEVESIGNDGRPKAWLINPVVHADFEQHATREMERRSEAAETIREMKKMYSDRDEADD